MKVRKDGTAKLEKGEVRVGNFFVKSEDEHIKIQDLNSVFTHRVNKRMPVGIWLSNMLTVTEGGLDSIHTYVATMWSVFSVVPDNDFIAAMLKEATGCIKRHPDWYGEKPDPTPEDDAEALKEVQEMKQFEEDVKNLSEKEKAEKGEPEVE